MTAAARVDANGALHDRSGRFTHAWLYETGPLPLLDRPSDTELPPLADPPETGTRVPVPAPRCRHGHFARWASRNCCAPTPTTGPAGPASAAARCEGSTATGEQCTRRTTRRDRTGHPACHLHGGHATPAV